MNSGAFRGSAELKERMVEPVRARWAARALVPDAALNWQRDDQPDSLGGALARTQDREEFEERTGIPAELAQLCELLLASGTQKAGAPDSAVGFSLEGAESLLAFGTEWLDAIRPGADLSLVMPQFARHFLGMLLRPDFPLAPYIAPEFRYVGLQISALWDRELAGHATARDDWRSVQEAALAADADTTPAWGYRAATLLEALAWPIRSISGEFFGLFEPLFFNWLMFLETPYMTDEERADREHLLIGLRAMAIAPRDNAGNMDVDPLETLPESQRVISADYITAAVERSEAVKDAARTRKDEVVRDLMDTILTLIRSA